MVQEPSYNAWGQLRNPANQTVYEPGSEPELFLGRGYTGHEHLPQFGLINMNARLYDPALGRFLSPDPYVQMPDFSQSFNRYAYALNNPFKYTDPEGELWWLIPIAIGGIINWAMNGADFTWEGLSYFGVGAVAGASILVGGPLAPVLAGGLTGAGNSFISQGFAGGDGNTWNGSNINFWQIGNSALMGAITGYVSGQIGGKISPYISQYTSKLGGPVVQDMVSNSLTSGATGFTRGAGITAINGGTFEESMQAGWSSAKVGLVTGAASGFVSGWQRARAENVHWFRGESTYKGIDIVGTAFNEVLPTQDYIDPYQVDIP